jgi:hypothetical protein
VAAEALEDVKDVPNIILTYDIACQYGVHFVKRMEGSFPHLSNTVQRVIHRIPKMHIYRHQLACQVAFALGYTKFAGQTVGELIETGWSEGDLTAGSTKEMNHGHRHDSLDDFHNFWNYLKQVTMSA